MEGIRAGDMRESNERQVRLHLMRFGDCTKKEIADGLGLSHPTVSKVLAEMSARGEAFCTGKEESYGGRCSEKYCLNADYAHVLIIILSPEELYYRISNLEHKKREDGILPVEGETHLARMAELISDVRGRFPRIGMVELGLPGNVLDGRLIYMCQDFYMLGRDVGGELERHCHLPIETCNDVNAMAYGFFRRHIEVSLRNDSMVYLFQNTTGPGAGIIVDGKIVNGFSGFAGEIYNVWPLQNMMLDQIKSQVAALISVVNPRFLVLSHAEGAPFDEEAVRAFVQEHFPTHSVPQLHFTKEMPNGQMPELYFTTEYRENYVEGLTELAIDAVVGKRR